MLDCCKGRRDSKASEGQAPDHETVDHPGLEKSEDGRRASGLGSSSIGGGAQGAVVPARPSRPSPVPEEVLRRVRQAAIEKAVGAGSVRLRAQLHRDIDVLGDAEELPQIEESDRMSCSRVSCLEWCSGRQDLATSEGQQPDHAIVDHPVVEKYEDGRRARMGGNSSSGRYKKATAMAMPPTPNTSPEEVPGRVPQAVAEKAAGAGSDHLAAVSLQRSSQDLNEAEVLKLRRMTERGMSAVATVEKSGKGAKYSGHYKFVQDPKGDDENADDSDFNTEETKAPLLKTAVAATVGAMASDHEGDGKGNAKDGEGKDDSKGGEGKFEDKGVEKRGSGMGQDSKVSLPAGLGGGGLREVLASEIRLQGGYAYEELAAQTRELERVRTDDADVMTMYSDLAEYVKGQRTLWASSQYTPVVDEAIQYSDSQPNVAMLEGMASRLQSQLDWSQSPMRDRGSYVVFDGRVGGTAQGMDPRSPSLLTPASGSPGSHGSTSPRRRLKFDPPLGRGYGGAAAASEGRLPSNVPRAGVTDMSPSNAPLMVVAHGLPSRTAPPKYPPMAVVPVSPSIQRLEPCPSNHNIGL